MKTPKTVPLSKLILEVVKLKVQRSVEAELQKIIEELEAYLRSMQSPSKPKRQRRAA